MEERIKNLEKELPECLDVFRSLPESHPEKSNYAEVLIDMQIEYFRLTGRLYKRE